MAEQDKYTTYFGTKANPTTSGKTIQIGVPDLSGRLGAEQDRYGGHFSLPSSILPGNLINGPATVGIFQSTILPSIGFHSGLAITAYLASRATDRVDGKDFLWPTAPVLNAWWSAVGLKVLNNNLSLSAAWDTVSYPERLLLAGITIWGGRLLYRTASQSITQKRDNEKYTTQKNREGFWNEALGKIFLPEALLQAAISLPFTLAFRDQHASALASPPVYHVLGWHMVAVGVWTAGMTLDALADAQSTRADGSSNGEVVTEGVWSIVRHPNYLGDALVHASFPLLLYSMGIMHPVTLLAPFANYAFLRYIRGDKEKESSQEERYRKEDPTKFAQLQEYKQQKQAFWPSLQELGNPWTAVVVAAGFGGAWLEYGIKHWL